MGGGGLLLSEMFVKMMFALMGKYRCRQPVSNRSMAVPTLTAWHLGYLGGRKLLGLLVGKWWCAREVEIISEKQRRATRAPRLLPAHWLPNE